VLRHQTGISQGFDFFDDEIEVAGTGESLSDSQRDGSLTVDGLAGWVSRQAASRVFAFLHLYEPHTPYTPPPSHVMRNPYDGEIAYADELVGRFLDRIAERGLLKRAIVAVVSDHGEGLNDHGEAEHGIFLYREALHVPWILRLPNGLGGGVRFSGTVGEVDVAATLLDLTGVERTALDGNSLAPVLGSGRTADRTVYSETWYPRLHFGWSDLASATDDRFQFIRAPKPELFDLKADPYERTNLAAVRASTASAMSAWIARTTEGIATPEPSSVSTEVRERLKSLGYVGSADPRVATNDTLPDPKDTIAWYEAFKGALALASAGRDADAVPELRRLVDRNPRMLDGWEALGKSLLKIGRTSEAIEAFNKVLEIDSLKPETHLALARILALERKPDLARRHAELAAERDPASAYEALAELSMDAGRPSEAASYAQRSIEADPTRYMSHFLLGVVAKQHGRCNEAIPEFERAIEAKRTQPRVVVRDLHAGLADCLARADRREEAEREFQNELSAIPWSVSGRVGLATLYRSEGRDAEARTVLEGLLDKTQSPSADTFWTVVHTFAVLGDTSAAREWAAKARQRFPGDQRFK
jgi:choline-sulfatase